MLSHWNARGSIARRLFGATAAGALLGAGMPLAVAAEGPATLSAQAEIVMLWGKLPVWRMTIDARVVRGGRSAGRYRVRTRNRALGVVWAMTKARGHSVTDGALARGRLVPRQYISDGSFRGKSRKITLTYKGSRTATTVTPKNGLEDWTPVPAALRQGAPDPLTAMVTAFRTTRQDPCGRSVEVYDGRRRYRITVTPAGRDTLKSSLWNRYSGPAVRCRITTKTIAGFYKEALKEKRPPQPPATIWFARFDRAGLWLPVKVVAKTRWGTIRGELFRYKLTAE